MTRRRFTELQRLKLFEAKGGKCHLCGNRIKVGERWDIEHIVALALGGEDGGENLAPAHTLCHSYKTKDDIRRIRKSDRQRAKHIGAKKRSTFPKPPPGSKWDWKLNRRIFEKEST